MSRALRYSRAYAALARVTPIPADCGRLCGARCCGGGEEHVMLLYPGEEARLQNRDGFVLRPEETPAGPAFSLRCSGHCRRRLRPFACRIYPLVPYIGKDGVPRAVRDPRARYLCPLLSGRFISREFRRAAAKAVRILCRDREIRSFIRRYSAVLDEYSKFTGDVFNHGLCNRH